jgi:biopolymer transport protein ExbB
MGFEHFIVNGDLVTLCVAVLLLLLSLSSWTIIARRFFAQLKINRSMSDSFQQFWQAGDLPTALDGMRRSDASGIFFGLADAAMTVSERHAQQQAKGIGEVVSASEILTRAMRNYIVLAQARIENGLTFLASVGSTAPFIGLFGTVWGIYHALVGLSGATHVVLDKVAGPVGEALIMTAAGLFVAIPAVLAYNALNRANRLVLAHLDGFAHDLHAYLLTGARINTLPQKG